MDFIKTSSAVLSWHQEHVPLHTHNNNKENPYWKLEKQQLFEKEIKQTTTFKITKNIVLELNLINLIKDYAILTKKFEKT